MTPVEEWLNNLKRNNMTAVEFLVNEFSEILGPLKTEPMQDMFIIDAINQAKKIEKQQQGYSEEDMREAWEEGRFGETETITIKTPPFYRNVFKYKTFQEWLENYKNK